MDPGILLCCESVLQDGPLCDDDAAGDRNLMPATTACADDAVIRDDRVLERLLELEAKYVVSPYSFRALQKEIRPEMREIVADWMHEVCVDQMCEDAVFPLAVNYMDRFLSLVSIRKSQLQLLGTVCLLIASKMRQCKALSAELLASYTDYSATREEILDWELIVLSRLKWDVSSVLPNDFVDHLLARLPLNQRTETIRRHSIIFITLCAKKASFMSSTPSIVATASVAAAIHGIDWPSKPWSSLQSILETLQQITGIEAECLQCYVEHIEQQISSLASYTVQQNFFSKTSSSPTNGNKHSCIANGSSSMSQNQPETPTDLQDICF